MTGEYMAAGVYIKWFDRMVPLMNIIYFIL